MSAHIEPSSVTTPWVVVTLMSDFLRLSCGITGDPDRALCSCCPDPCLAVQFGGDAFAAAVAWVASVAVAVVESTIAAVQALAFAARRASCPGGPAVQNAAALRPHAAGSGISRIESAVRSHYSRPVVTTRRLSISAPPVQICPHLMATMIGRQERA